ncbi:hypothetical protein Lser_V15G03067 [Lactuca serriola]
MQLCELGQLHGVLGLLRNSPNNPELDEGPALNHLETPLNQLLTVKMTVFEGSRTEILFLKLLLAHSPSLKKFTITPCGACGVDIVKDVIQFPEPHQKQK